MTGKCQDAAHLSYDRAPVRDLAALIEACVELDQVIDSGMLQDMTERERQILQQVRYALRKITGNYPVTSCK